MTALDSMRGKIGMVTGANAGIGRATALGLAKLGATVVMVCRDASRGQMALAEIREESGNPAVELMLADLSSQAAIRKLAADYKRTHDRLHVLINNAGVIANRRIVTEDGIELLFAVNHLAYFMLTMLLLDVLKTSAPARIVNVTSAAESFGTINFDDLMSAQKYTPMGAISQAKLANVMFTYELARRLEGSGVTVNCLNPGAVRTKITQDMGGWYGLMARLARPFAKTPEQGAETPLYLATSSEVEGVSGQYFENKKAKPTSRKSYDTVAAQRLWDVCADLTRLEPTALPA
jgi:NAD(P)-dependent dehydrogenase (short-subunit alcohol dehydrogenase family)